MGLDSAFHGLFLSSPVHCKSPFNRELFSCRLTHFSNSMQLLRTFLSLALPFASLTATAQAETITSAQYAAPVNRYGHFALGQPHEYARLTVTTDSGRRLELELPEDEVFEDLKPRVVTLASGEPAEVLAIVSRRGDGSRLVMFGLSGERLAISAESPAIGTPKRWLNPVAGGPGRGR